jgi:hypothetical protein
MGGRREAPSRGPHGIAASVLILEAAAKPLSLINNMSGTNICRRRDRRRNIFTNF